MPLPDGAGRGPGAATAAAALEALATQRRAAGQVGQMGMEGPAWGREAVCMGPPWQTAEVCPACSSCHDVWSFTCSQAAGGDAQAEAAEAEAAEVRGAPVCPATTRTSSSHTATRCSASWHDDIETVRVFHNSHALI